MCAVEEMQRKMVSDMGQLADVGLPFNDTASMVYLTLECLNIKTTFWVWDSHCKCTPGTSLSHLFNENQFTSMTAWYDSTLILKRSLVYLL